MAFILATTTFLQKDNFNKDTFIIIIIYYYYFIIIFIIFKDNKDISNKDSSHIYRFMIHLWCSRSL